MWYLPYMEAWTVKMSSGYRRCWRSSAGIFESGVNIPGKAFSYVSMIGSFGSIT